MPVAVSVPRFAETSALLRRAAAIHAACRATRASIRVQRRRSPLRRLCHLARGASDGPVVERDQTCPHCASEATRPAGYVLAAGGLIYERQQCATCDKPFLLARAPIRTVRTWAIIPSARPVVPPPSEP